MHTKIPVSIVIDEQENRWVWPAYKPLPLPNGHTEVMVNPMVMVESGEVHEAIEAHRAWNQKLVNSILSKHF